jgi:hypothetical protein
MLIRRGKYQLVLLSNTFHFSEYIIFKHINLSLSGIREILNNEMSTIYAWSTKWLVSLNLQKTETMTIN